MVVTRFRISTNIGRRVNDVTSSNQSYLQDHHLRKIPVHRLQKIRRPLVNKNENTMMKMMKMKIFIFNWLHFRHRLFKQLRHRTRKNVRLLLLQLPIGHCGKEDDDTMIRSLLFFLTCVFIFFFILIHIDTRIFSCKKTLHFV